MSLLRGAIERHNAYADDPVMMRGGWRMDRDELYAMADAKPGDIDFVQTYDDYPVIVMLQFEDLGFCDKGDGPGFRARSPLHMGWQLPQQHQRWTVVGRPGWRGRRVSRHDRGDPATHRPGGRSRRAAGQARPGQRLRHGHLRPLLVHRRRDPRGGALTPPLLKPKRKNPVLRTRQINLPPSARGRVALGLTAAAAMGRFELQQCAQCNAVMYPLREACPQCASVRLRWREQGGEGELLAGTTLHHSNDLFFRERLPWRLGLVKLEGAGRR